MSMDELSDAYRRWEQGTLRGQRIALARAIAELREDMLEALGPWRWLGDAWFCFWDLLCTWER